MAQLHPQLANDCLLIGRFPLCHVLLMRDANYPWFILVPDRENITELYQLSEQDQQQFIKESNLLSKTLASAFDPHKLNIAALGNVVPQLHVHHVVRYQDDVAWPKPIWGNAPAKPYDEATLKNVLSCFMQAMDSNEFESSI